MKPIEHGDTRVIERMPEAEYRAVQAISASDLSHIIPPKTPAHYAAHMAGELKREPSRAMLFGTLCHLAALEPDRLAGAYMAKPAGLDMRTKEGKAFKEAAGTLPVVDEDEERAILGVRDALAAHPEASDLLSGVEMELSLFANGEGLWLKGRVDGYNDRLACIVDIKTTQDASAGAFRRTIANLHYHAKAAHYLNLAAANGMEDLAFYWIAVEVAPPFAVAVYEPSDSMLAAGEQLRSEALATIAECEESGRWPGYGDGTRELDLPAWAGGAA